MFGPASDAATRPTFGDAAEPGGRQSFGPAAPSSAIPPIIAPRIRKMRHAATIDLFDRCGLTIVPAPAWRFIDAGDDVAHAFADFLAAIGADPEAVRRGEPGEIERVNDILDLLVETEPAFARLGQGALDRIERAFFSGEHARVRSAAGIVAVYESIAALGASWPDERRLATFTAFLDDIVEALADPLTSTGDDAVAAERIAEDLAALLARFDHARVSHARRLDDLRTEPDWSRWPEAGEIEREIVRFADLVEQLRIEPFTIAECVMLLDALDAADATITAILAMHEPTASHGHAGRGTGPKPPPSSRELALLFFGLALGETPTAEAFKARKRQLEKETYPPPAGRGSEDRFKEFGQHRDVLKGAFGFR